MELKGPPASIARDEDGAWSKAALGFAKKNGIEPDSLEVRNFDGRDYLYTALNVQGASLKDILKQEAPEWIKGLNFPKNMRWGHYKMRFARPVRWLVSLWNEEVLHFSLEMVEAGKHTLGHRFLSPKPSELLHAQDYHSHLHNHFVEADFNNRRNEILSQIRELESKHNCTDVPHHVKQCATGKNADIQFGICRIAVPTKLKFSGIQWRVENQHPLTKFVSHLCASIIIRKNPYLGITIADSTFDTRPYV